ncbi:unnamed protein product [Thelazia callipaeda]|uniref:MARVEL domain-containing protein n=1 Tax=Thelazia callipaeda TaxID=103827 RepID=A0A0N5D8T5_THECL|nr:unnamed protein product [Thelazia callipaeda]
MNLIIHRETQQYYTCFGRIHVQTALLTIIILTFGWNILRWIDLFLRHDFVFGWIEILTEVCDVSLDITLIIAYCYKSSYLLLPYLFLQLLALVVSMISFCICALTVIWPENPWVSIVYTDESAKTSKIRVKAFIYGIISFAFSLVLIWVIRILLSCYVYFSNQKNAAANIAVATTQISGSNEGVLISSSTGLSCTNNVTTNAPVKSTLADAAFPNPSFCLEDDDDEDQLWPQTDIQNSLNLNESKNQSVSLPLPIKNYEK